MTRESRVASGDSLEELLKHWSLPEEESTPRRGLWARASASTTSASPKSDELASLILRLQLDPPTSTPSDARIPFSSVLHTPRTKSVREEDIYLTPRASYDTLESASKDGLSPLLGARIDDRRRAALGWPSSAELSAAQEFDPLDALDVINRLTKLHRNLNVDGPWQGNGLKSFLNLLDEARLPILSLQPLGPNLIRLAALRDDAKLPLPIFREVEIVLSRHPEILLSQAHFLMRGPSSAHWRADAKGSLKRVMDCLCSETLWRDGKRGGSRFLTAFRQSVQTQAFWRRALPMTPKEDESALLLAGRGGNAYCFLSPTTLVDLLTRSEDKHVFETLPLSSPDDTDFNQALLLVDSRLP